MTQDPILCEQCGRPHVRCAGHIKVGPKKGEPCGQPRMRGQRVCRKHGGKAPQTRAAAERRLQEQAAEAAIRRLLDDPDAAPVTDPVTQLQRLAGRMLNAVDEIGVRVNRLDESLRYSADGSGTEQLRAEVAIWERLLGRLHVVLVDMAKLGIEERAQAMSEARGARIAEVVGWIFEELDLSEAQWALVPEVVPRQLRRAITAGQGVA